MIASFLWNSVSQPFFKWGPLLSVRMFYGPPYSCPLWKKIEILNYSVWYVIHVNLIFSVFFFTNVQSMRTTRSEPEDHLWSADHSLRNAALKHWRNGHRVENSDGRWTGGYSVTDRQILLCGRINQQNAQLILWLIYCYFNYSNMFRPLSEAIIRESNCPCELQAVAAI
jgi:hypothetical protein